MREYHCPVLLTESVEGLLIKPEGVYVDVTFGGGGHSKAILSRLGASGKLYAFDQDQEALQNTIADDRLVLINHNFRYLKRFLRFYGVTRVDGILADLGVSSHQFNAIHRGFSTRLAGDLDMRMDQTQKISAYKVINSYEAEKLAWILRHYGELRNAFGIANAIVAERQKNKIQTNAEFKAVLSPFLPAHKANKILAQIYQAIRIEVNQELAVLKAFLLQTLDLLTVGGRLSVISYHSLEYRLVKRFMRNGLFEGEPEKDLFGNVSVPFKRVAKLIVPSPEEVGKNNRARSAKLRVAERI